MNNELSSDPSKVAFRAAYYQPTYSKYANETIAGVQWLVERTLSSAASDGAAAAAAAADGVAYTPFATGTAILCAAARLAQPVGAFQWDGSWFGHPGSELIDEYAGTPCYREMIDAGLSAAAIAAHFKPEADAFASSRSSYLLY